MRFRQENFIEKTKNIILRPSKFFDKAKKENKYSTTFRYFLKISLISSLLSSFYVYYSFEPTDTLIDMIGIYLTSVFITLISHIEAVIVHLAAKILKGQGNFLSTYKSILYGSVPHYLFVWAPLVSIVFYFYYREITQS